MTAVLGRALAILDQLAGHPSGVPLGSLAQQLEIPKSAAHRLLAELIGLGYVRQDHASGDYALGLPVVALGLRHLRAMPLVETAGAALIELAEMSGELARLSIFDGELLVWVAKRQGAKTGLRYDPDSGAEVDYATTASGIAWLSTLPEDEVRERVAAQRRRRGEDDAPDASLPALVERARRDGYCYADSTYELGLAGVAVPIAEPGRAATGVLSVAGPSVRFSDAEARAVVPRMIELAASLAPIAEHGLEAPLTRWQ